MKGGAKKVYAERDKKICALYDEGLSFTQIAERVGGTTTRDAVAGVCKREGKKNRGSEGVIDMMGLTFGRLTVIARAAKATRPPFSARWLCECTCGKQKVIVGYSLRRKNTRSCGCLRSEKSSARLKAGHRLAACAQMASNAA